MAKNEFELQLRIGQVPISNRVLDELQRNLKGTEVQQINWEQLKELLDLDNNMKGNKFQLQMLNMQNIITQGKVEPTGLVLFIGGPVPGEEREETAPSGVSGKQTKKITPTPNWEEDY